LSNPFIGVAWRISAGLCSAAAYLGAVILYGCIFLSLFGMDAAAAEAERAPALRRVMQWTYTRTLSRYAAPGFKPFAAPGCEERGRGKENQR
jgi:hypothetical protein